VIYGKTGSGKSLILAGIIGEADLLAGKINSPNSPLTNDARVCPATEENWIIPSSLAYVAQIPWIENATIKSNILYLLPFDPVRYASVLYASALEPDLAVLPDGDETEVGATGINLSGGQRQRLTFARALYSRASTLVLDDIFGAVDAHVGQHMVKYGLERELSTGRTIIVATHHVNLVLPLASYVVKVETDGSVQGFAQQPVGMGMGIQEESKDIMSSGLSDVQSLEDLVLEEIKASSTTRTSKGFVEEETRDQGRVKWRVYQSYVRASGGWFYWTFTILIFGASAFLLFSRAYWIKTWTEASESPKATQTRTPDADRNTASYGSDDTPQVVYYLGVYLAISFFSVIFIAIKIILVLLAALWSSKTLFENLTARILRAQLRWLDTVPTGRILNRFIGDFALIDSQLGMDLVLFLNRLFAMGTVVVAALLLSAWMVFPIIILGLACIYYTSFYLAGARDIRRLESITKSPVFDLFDSALSGLSTIRSFGRVDDYRDRMRSRIDEYARASWYIILANRWVAFRQGLLGAVFALCLAASIVILPNINVALAAFALSFGIEFSRVVIIAIAQYAGFELDMNSTERVVEYITQTPVEEELGLEMPTHWPSQGQVVFANFETGYANHLPSVLKGINLHIKSRERVGICGRTGSGKSSLTLALFRFLEARKGSISIDGLDISQVKLRDLRHQLAIIPQDPVLFSGTLRTNLDPFNEYNDGVLWNALQRVHLVEQDKTYPGPSSSPPNGSTGNRNIFEDLEFNISRGGLNLSSGQRQLLCLARAILTRSKILVLDEATSAVDVATDNLIQRGIRENFENSTLIVIAHRLSTLSDFDKIVVLDDGRVVEFDTPQALIDQKGVYWQMLSESALNTR
jgi:ABC-type multidrug transport system fused ATPase/permease subunit